jgi:hypothetical protein
VAANNKGTSRKFKSREHLFCLRAAFQPCLAWAETLSYKVDGSGNVRYMNHEVLTASNDVWTKAGGGNAA